jgi:hypothetical protein
MRLLEKPNIFAQEQIFLLHFNSLKSPLEKRERKEKRNQESSYITINKKPQNNLQHILVAKTICGSRIH